MVVMDHPAGPRSSYKQWEENNRPSSVVFEFISKSHTAEELMDKLENFFKKSQKAVAAFSR